MHSLEILNLDDFFDINKLKTQYKKMVKKYHPDLNQSGCSEKIIKLNNAYSSLIKFLKNKFMTNLIKKEIKEKNKNPDINLSARKVFNISWDIEIPAFSEKDDYVPDIDENYFLKKTLQKQYLQVLNIIEELWYKDIMEQENLLI